MEICTQIGSICVPRNDRLDMMLNHHQYGHVVRLIDQNFQNKFSMLQNLNFCAKKKNLMTVRFIVWSWRSIQMYKLDKIAYVQTGSGEFKSFIDHSLIEISKDVREQEDDRLEIIPPMMKNTIKESPHKIVINKELMGESFIIEGFTLISFTTRSKRIIKE